MSSISRQGSGQFMSSTDQSSSTFNYTLICPSGNNRLVVVGVVFEEDSVNYRHVTGVTFSGVSMTQLSESPLKFPSSGLQCSIAYFYMLDSALPSTGGSKSVLVSLDGTCTDEIHSYISEYSDVNQSPPDDADSHYKTKDGDTKVKLEPSTAGSLGVIVCGSGGTSSPYGSENGCTTVVYSIGTSSCGALGEQLDQSLKFTMGYNDLEKREGSIGAVWQPDASGGSGSNDAIAQIGTTKSASDDNTTTLSKSYTHPGGYNTAIVVAASNKKQTFSSVTYDGITLTKAVEDVASDYRCSLWYIVGVAAKTATLTMTISGSEALGMIATSWENVDQSAPIRFSAHTNASGGDPSVACSSAEGDVVVDCTTYNEDSHDLEVGSNQTELAEVDVSNEFHMGSSREVGSVSGVTMSWVAPHSGNQWSSCAVSLRATAQEDEPTHQMLL